ncbi:thioredoxin [Sediminibacterium ginsengisoli]|nr:thioredoxin [Sediminibacterium ginsengisoli]
MDLYLIPFNSDRNRKEPGTDQSNQSFKTITMALELTDANFQSTVLDSDKLTVVDFWAEWCGPCRAIGPIIEELSKEYEGKVNVGKVNVDHNPNLSVNYGITSIPAILFIKNGQIVDKQIGAVPKSVFDKKIQAHL